MPDSIFSLIFIVGIILILCLKTKAYYKLLGVFAFIIAFGIFLSINSKKEKAIERQNASEQAKREKRQQEIKAYELQEKRRQDSIYNAKIEKHGYWKYSSETDEITGKTIKFASLKSENWHRFSFPYDQESNWLGLHLRRNPNLDIYLTIEAGQFHNPNKTIQVRFDNTVRTYSYSEESSGRSDIIFIDNPHDFLRRLLKSDTTKIRCTFYDEGSYTYTFVTRKLKF